MHDHIDVRRASGTLIRRCLLGEGDNVSLEQDRVSLISDIDDVSSSDGEDSSSEGDAEV